MNNTFVRFASRMLVASLIWLPLQAQAELIATSQAVSAAQAQSARALVAGQLQVHGLAPGAAGDRVAALTDAEVLSLADRIERLPAGAIAGQTMGIIAVLVFLIWRFGYSDQARAEAAKPAAKPAPEQKK